jgi:hypothetical protein
VVSEVVGVRLTAPKFVPVRVSEPPPLTAALAEARCVKTGAAYQRHFARVKRRSVARRIAPSKLNRPVSVPIFALTLSAVRTAEPPYACGAHARVVSVVQVVELHTSAVVSEAVTVRSTSPKFTPMRVSEPPPLTAALAEARCVKTGAA